MPGAVLASPVDALHVLLRGSQVEHEGWGTNSVVTVAVGVVVVVVVVVVVMVVGGGGGSS